MNKKAYTEEERTTLELLEFIRRLSPQQNLVTNQEGKWCVRVNGETVSAYSHELYDLFKEQNSSHAEPARP